MNNLKRTILLTMILALLLAAGILVTAQDEEKAISVYSNDRAETSLLAHGGITGDAETLFNALHCSMLNLTDNFELAPDLAESYEVSEDGTTYTFMLNPDAKWHDGEPVTAEDVEFSWVAYATAEAQTGSRIREPVITSVVGGEEVRASAAEAEGYADTLKYEGIEIVDDHTIKFTLTGPNPLWIITSHQNPNGWLLPKHILQDVPWNDWRTHPMALEAPVGCGPFQFVQRVDGQFVELEAFDDYHLGRPNIDRMFWKSWLTADVGAAQMETGELDLMLSPTLDDAERLEQDPGIQILSAPSASAYQFSVNTERVPDTNVRLAMAHAIDREGILEAVFGGVGVVQECCLLNDWAIPEGQVPYEYNPDLARQLLEEAGWDSSQELSIIYPLDYRQSDVIVPIVQQQLAEVGINTYLDPQEQTAFRQKLVEEKDWDLFFTQGANMLPDPGSFTVWECPTGGFAQSGWIYCDDEMANLYEAGRSTVDFDERQEIYQAIQTIFYEEQPSIYVVLPSNLFAARSNLTGLTPTANRAQIFWNVHEWDLASE